MGVVPPLSFFEQSRLRDYDCAQNTLVDYAGTHHVCMARRFYLTRTIVGEFCKVLKGSSYYEALQRSEDDFGTEDLQALLACLAEQQRPVALKLYYASMAYYPRFRELLNDVVKWKRAREENGVS